MNQQGLVLGTAGHVDHGKTALVKALTGHETDRLAEERSRGISIELGYAPLALPGGRHLSVIDVPGHERFVRTMVAGATGIDMFLLCVAADDGVMPQTREHLAVLQALGVTDGLVAITKCDLAGPAKAAAQLQGHLPDTAQVHVAAPHGRGLDELRCALAALADTCQTRSTIDGPVRLHVDRVFTVNGAGTVATGTLWSGRIAVGDDLQVLPQGSLARVRSVQVHGAAVAAAAAGARVAVNLTGPGRREVARGGVICEPGSGLAPTFRLEAKLTHDPAGRGRLHAHHGTRDTPARVTPLPGGRHRLTFERPLLAAAGDRFVLRTVAPPDTIGGGVVLDPHPARRRAARPQPNADPPARATDAPAAVIGQVAALLAGDGVTPRGHGAIASALGLPSGDVRAALTALERQGRAVRVGRDLHYDAPALRAQADAVLEICRRDGGATTIATVRDELGTTRRYAEAVLSHLDAARITLRRGDEHVLRARGAQASETFRAK
jgi:selenocysteine-specific elongation factor